ncbi:MAG TPA: GNAT family protein [bacterium]|nr:GNAT family protein [bacterium]
MRLEPVTLEGRHVRLEPLSLEHHDALCRVGLDEDLWRLSPILVESAEEMRRYIETALQAQADGTALPFAIVERGSGTAIGSTRYGNIDRAHRRVEIGWTWIARPWQRTAVNTECKYLLLRHAFETLGCIRVEFKTDVLNARSRQALLRIGAKEEGILRSHMVTATGRIRDSVYFSIVDREWPMVKARLEEMVQRPFPSPRAAT